MKKLIFISVLFLSLVSFSQDMRQNSFQSLFSDFKANKEGDAITIIVVESSQATNEAETSTERGSDLGFNGNNKVGKINIPEISLGLSSKNNFKGTGSTKTSGRVTAKISAMIDTVFSNGNLRIKGSRKILINGEEQTFFIKGIVRSSDIQADNSVLSYNISEAEIIMGGSGIIERSQSPGWITKFLHYLF